MTLFVLSLQSRHLLLPNLSEQVYKSYGKLLCLQELLLGKDATKSRRDLRTEPGPLKDFFDSLNGNQLETIFGYDPIHPDLKPTLAFAVDDTGSMHDEIESVKKLIYSFIKTERSDSHAYILTTFNDPG